MKLKLAQAGLLIFVGSLAFLFRFPDLCARPVHTDEAVHAYKTGTLFDQGIYIYDPHEYHGPTLYYAALPLLWLTGANTFADIPTVTPFRMVPVIFGTMLVVLVWLMFDGIGGHATFWIAVLTALSPAFVYYSRYYIQEMLLVCFTFAAIGFGWRYVCTRRWWWAVAVGVCLGLMQSTKETSIIAYGAMLFGVFVSWAWQKKFHQRSEVLPKAKHLAIGAGTAVVVTVFLLSVCGENWSAAQDCLGAYSIYFARGVSGDGATVGSGAHHHPWYYYWSLLLYTRLLPGVWWSEGFILLLALVGAFSVLGGHSQTGVYQPFGVFWIGYTLFLTIGYAVIPYKTPWCLLGFWHGWIILAGLGVAWLWYAIKWRWLHTLAMTLVLLGVFHLSWQAYQASYVFKHDPRNPYVYAHTASDLSMLVQRIEDLSEVHPKGKALMIYVAVPDSDYWPLPWELRQFTQVGYWDTLPLDSEAPVVVTTPQFGHEFSSRATQSYINEYYGLRYEVLLMMFIEQSLWQQLMATREESRL